MKINTLALSLAAAIALTACSEKAEDTAAVSAETAPANPHAGMQAPSNPALTSHQGTVIETVAAGGYTYARVDLGEAELWLAGPESRLDEGTKVYWDQGALMSNSESPTLGRTFEQVLFVSRFLSEQDFATANTGPQGTVKSVEHAAGYVYLEVVQGDEIVWVAAPDADVNVDDTVEWHNASLMNGFHSSSLDRTFDAIYFAGSVSVM